jgi:hypothetical protein
MKYLAIALLGLLLGAAAAGAVLYFNPLTAERAPATGNYDGAWRYALPQDALTFERGMGTYLPDEVAPAGELWEKSIQSSALLALRLRDAEGNPSAIASRLLAGSRETDLLLRGLLVADHWLITVPGQGSVFVRAETNVWPLLKDTVIPVRYLDRAWEGPIEIKPTAGPHSTGAALAIGATGSFASVRGEAAEAYRLNGIAPLAADGQLLLDLPDALTTTAAQDSAPPPP